jgi:ribulose-bisphosphate carboxylase small chain
MWNLPLFDLAPEDAHLAMREVAACREQFPDHYVKLIAYDASYGRQTTALSFIVNRPADEPGFRLERADRHDRTIEYRLHSYATDAPSGRRYQARGAGD